jgi:hypothetical protein
MGRGITQLVSVVASVRPVGLLGADVAVTVAVSRHLIRRYRQVVQDRPSLAVCWADIPGLYVSVGRCPVAWQQSQQPALDRLACRQGRADDLRVAEWSNPQDNVNRRRMK